MITDIAYTSKREIKFDNPTSVEEFMNEKYKLNRLAYESLYLLILDNKLLVRAVVLISVGGSDYASFPISKMLSAVLISDKNFITVHNYSYKWCYVCFSCSRSR